jgi:hypothetical protein
MPHRRSHCMRMDNFGSYLLRQRQGASTWFPFQLVSREQETAQLLTRVQCSTPSGNRPSRTGRQKGRQRTAGVHPISFARLASTCRYVTKPTLIGSAQFGGSCLSKCKAWPRQP